MAYSTTTRSTLRTRVRERLLNTFWADAELNAYINEALRVWNVCTGYQRNIYSSITFASGTFGYPVSTINASAMFVLRIELTGNTHLDPITLKELGNLDPTWVSRTAATATNWMQVGATNVFLYPKLTGAQTGSTVYTLDSFTVPSVDGDFIQVGEEDLQYIVDYCVFIARLKEGGKEATDAIQLLQGFLKQAAKYNSKIQQTSLYKRVLGIPFQRQTREPSLEQNTAR